MSARTNASERPVVRACRLGRVDYVETARLQRGLRAAREAGAIGDVLLLLEHDAVITCGTRTEEAEVAVARSTDIPIVAVERGGKATWHGPGQVVAYPVLDVAVVRGDVRELVRRLERAITVVLGAQGIDAAGRDGLPGVWVDAAGTAPRKVASVGLRLTRGITFHGVALNVANDLAPFDWFTPCGIPDARMTSIVRELGIDGRPASELELLVREVEGQLLVAIADVFGYDVEPVDRDELDEVAARFAVPDPTLPLPWERSSRRTTRIDLAAGATR